MMGRTFYVKTDNASLSKAIRSISAFDGKARLGVENAVRKGTKAIGRTARQKAPVRTGGLRKSIRTSFKSRAISGEVKAYAPHAHLVEFGAKGGYVVKPKNKKALTVMGYGIQRFSAKAVIPPRRAHPFMKPAYDAHDGEIITDVEKAIQKA